MKKSVQELMDERMCRPGYRWNDTLKRCLGTAGGGDIDVPEKPGADLEPPPGQKPGAPAEPVGNGRGSKRVNAAGIQQTGTKMGGKMSIK